MSGILDLFYTIKAALLSLGNTIRVEDVVDILIVALVIYLILTIMRKTNASSVIKGIIFLLVIAWLSNFFELATITYILDQVLQAGILLLVILFQPEIRKLFEQVGSSKVNVIFRKRVKLENAESVLKNVITAALSMAKSKTGAIIVFEREVGLNDYVATGTRIDASISSELIQSIFFNHSPLHDGALLIRDGRALAAACMLPMSSNINLSRELGMRHRAGIGISERSDAVTVIVSEETGTVSVAVDGMLKRHLDGDTFEKLLYSEFMPKEKSKKQKEKQKKKEKKSP